MSSDDEIDAVLKKLSVQDKIKLLTGLGWWHTEPIPEHDIPSVRFSDGPNGARGTRFFNGVPSSCFPSPIGLGSSFDTHLVDRIGQAIGDECRAKSTHVLLAPTVNTQRSPLGGRGFESFSEDPHLNGIIAASYIGGVQTKGVSATIKHFVANDQEFERFSISSEVSERALREIYLKPFQIAIKKANPWALMTAYNRVNGIHASENNKLLQDILLKEWKYKGLVMSDWTGVYSTVESVKAGVDLEMPGPSVMRGQALLRTLVAHKITLNDIDKRVANVLKLVDRAKESGIPFSGPEGSVDTPELRQLLRAAAADSVVLLKNDKHILPLKNSYKKIAVIGPNAKVAITSGGGSAGLLPTYTVSPLQGIREAARAIGADVEYAIGTPSHKYLPGLQQYIWQVDGQPGALMEFWNEAPTPNFISTSNDFGTPLPRPIWSTPTLGSNCVLFDGIDAEKVNTTCYMRYSAKFKPDEDGDWEIGLNFTGHANLFIDQKLIIEFVPTASGVDGFNAPDVRAVAKDLRAGQEYDLEIRMSNAFFASSGIPFPCWGVMRAGAVKIVDADVSIREAVALAHESDVVILVIGLNNDWETEGADRQDMELPGRTNDLVAEILRANTNTVIVNQSGTPVSMPWASKASTLLQAFYGGNELGNGLADVLFGLVNPSAKLPLTFPIRLEDNPSYPSYGDNGQESGKIYYNEGIFVGYRGYEIRKLAPLFPFGFGLTYSTFEYSNLATTEVSPDGHFNVSFDIKNSSRVPGREVAQLYVSDAQSSRPRPIKELKAFVKVALNPGETKRVDIALDREALSFYNEVDMCWVAESGTFGIHVGASSTDVRLKGEVKLDKTFTWTGL
ncbi:glycoside hydrolase family 3 protein [Pholiota conissans]|uniref:beta-glucosidase n=1 Tax=Pholiota conissans TaxID=109636 RepID=A0A9P5ZEF8_9AGAR|nr:glycoside hydrolase family 3 protein [Pholiota conissans]